MTFGERLRQMRENAGFSREQVVSMLGDGFSYSSLQKYEDGRRRFYVRSCTNHVQDFISATYILVRA